MRVVPVALRAVGLQVGSRGGLLRVAGVRGPALRAKLAEAVEDAQAEVLLAALADVDVEIVGQLSDVVGSAAGGGEGLLFQLPRSRCERKKGQKCPGPPSRALPFIQLEEVGGSTESPWVAAECW